MLSGFAAKALADAEQTGLGDVGPHCLPWSCCALCPMSLGLHAFSEQVPPDSPLAFQVGTLAYYAGDLTTALLVRDSVLTDVRAELRAEQAIGSFYFWDEAPEYVRRAVEVMGQRRREFDLLDQLDLPRDLAGFTVWAAGQ